MNNYELLGVREGANQQAIDAAYKTISKRLSHGTLPEEEPLARDLMHIVDTAYTALSRGYARERSEITDVELSSQKKSLLRNLQNNKYQVEAPRRAMVTFPQRCACCMAENPQKTVKVKAQKFFVLFGQQLSTLVPICDECDQHNKKARRLFYLLTILPPLAGLGLTVLFPPSSFPGFSVYLLIAVFSISVFLIGSLLVRFNRYSLAHASHNMPVRTKRYTGKTITFDFDNWAYAKLFAQLNDGNLTVKRQRNHVASRCFIFGYYPFDSAVVFLMLWILIACFLHTMF